MELEKTTILSSKHKEDYKKLLEEFNTLKVKMKRVGFVHF